LFCTRQFQHSKVPAGHVPTTWIVTTRSRDAEIDKGRKDNTPGGKAIKWWPQTNELKDARVVVYALPRDRTKNPWEVAP
jgi:hypothetical protein